MQKIPINNTIWWGGGPPLNVASRETYKILSITCLGDAFKLHEVCRTVQLLQTNHIQYWIFNVFCNFYIIVWFIDSTILNKKAQANHRQFMFGQFECTKLISSKGLAVSKSHCLLPVGIASSSLKPNMHYFRDNIHICCRVVGQYIGSFFRLQRLKIK